MKHALILDSETGEPRIFVVDANDLSDPAWNPPGCTQVEISDAFYKANVGFDGHANIIAHARAEAEIKLGKKFPEKPKRVLPPVVEETGVIE